jgi:hypothetical protein
MSARWPRNVTVNRELEPLAQRGKSLPWGRDYRSLTRPYSSRSYVTLRDLIEREGEGS